MTFLTIDVIINVEVICMIIKSMEFQNVIECSKHLKLVIDSYNKKLPFGEPEKIFSWNDLVYYLGETFDIIKNRQLCFGNNGYVSTMHNILRPSRVMTLTKALKEYNLDLYSTASA